MKTVKTFFAISTLTLISFGSFAQSVTATASTLDGAEAKIAAVAKQQGVSYRIIEANFKNEMHMTAELTQ
jgi:hypothetical protein